MTQLAVKTWSVVARHLHEGGSIVTLHKNWDPGNEAFVILPSYHGQDPDAIKPDVWMTLRHELKPPLEGHSYIRDYAEVVTSIPVQSPSALSALEDEHALTRREAERRFHADEPGLVALVLRVYRMPRSYKFHQIAEKDGEGESELVHLPFGVAVEDLTPVVEDSLFASRRARLEAALPTPAVSDVA